MTLIPAFQDGRSAEIGADQAIVKYSSDNRSYVAAKVIAGFGTLIYMAVTSVPFGWEEGGFAKFNWPEAKAEVPNEKDKKLGSTSEFNVPPIDGWTREMSHKYGALHLVLEDQKSPKTPKRRPKGTTTPKLSLKKRYAHFDPTEVSTPVSVMDLPVSDEGLPNPQLTPRVSEPQRSKAFDINFEKLPEDDATNLIKFNAPALSPPPAPEAQQEVAAEKPDQ